MKFIVIGDTHNNNTVIIKKILDNDLRDVSLFHVGDFGAGIGPWKLERATYLGMNEFFKERNITLYVTRGNHDCPAYFQENPEDIIDARMTWIWESAGKSSRKWLKNKPEQKLIQYANELVSLSNIKFVKDYSVINVNGDEILCVGGAISINRYDDWTTHGVDYWPEEKFVYDYDKLKEIKGIQYVITHNAPDFCHPILWDDIVYRFAAKDLALHQELPRERGDLALMQKVLQENNLIQTWFYGHFHCSHTELRELTDYRCLNINEFYEVR